VPTRFAKVYDLYNAGPRHRFQANKVIVSNCFGLAYGLGGAGLADQLSLEFKRYVGTDEAQKIIDGYFQQYPGLRTFFDTCKVEVEQKGYVETPFGSRRYFPGFHKIGRDKQAKMKREGGNAKIQGSVAIMLDKASVLLDEVRYDTDIGRQIGWEYILAVHDAMYVHTPAWAAETTAGIVKWAMESIMIPGLNKGLQVDSGTITRWGEEE
jgi:DNA polymerase-1